VYCIFLIFIDIYQVVFAYCMMHIDDMQYAGATWRMSVKNKWQQILGECLAWRSHVLYCAILVNAIICLSLIMINMSNR